MSDQLRRLNRLQALYRRPPAWTVHFTERASDDRLVDVHTGEAVDPGPKDTVIEFRTFYGTHEDWVPPTQEDSTR